MIAQLQALNHKPPRSCPGLTTSARSPSCSLMDPTQNEPISSFPCSKPYQICLLFQLKLIWIPFITIQLTASITVPLYCPRPLHSGHTDPLCSVNTPKAAILPESVSPVTSWDSTGLCLLHFPTSAHLVLTLQPPRNRL